MRFGEGDNTTWFINMSCKAKRSLGRSDDVKNLNEKHMSSKVTLKITLAIKT